MEKSSACIIGATGLVGSLLLDALCSEDTYDNVISLSRKPITTISDKHSSYVVDFNNLEDYSFLFDTDDLFICIGTTLKNAGSKERFVKIDKGFAVQAAKHFNFSGGRRIFLVSATGANPKSLIFYNRIKGEIEQEILEMKFFACYIFRPGLLLGERNEKRLLENAARKVYTSINRLTEPISKSYFGTKVKDLVSCILRHSRENQSETKIISNREIKYDSNEK